MHEALRAEEGPLRYDDGRDRTSQAIGNRADRSTGNGQVDGTHGESSSGARAHSRKKKKRSQASAFEASHLA
jgi:hypothetical protein